MPSQQLIPLIVALIALGIVLFFRFHKPKARWKFIPAKGNSPPSITCRRCCRCLRSMPPGGGGGFHVRTGSGMGEAIRADPPPASEIGRASTGAAQGRVLYAVGRQDGATGAGARWRKSRPRLLSWIRWIPGAALARGRAMRQLGQLASAAVFYQQALKLQPTHSVALPEFAATCRALGQPSRARKALAIARKELGETHPLTIESRVQLGELVRVFADPPIPPPSRISLVNSMWTTCGSGWRKWIRIGTASWRWGARCCTMTCRNWPRCYWSGASTASAIGPKCYACAGWFSAIGGSYPRRRIRCERRWRRMRIFPAARLELAGVLLDRCREVPAPADGRGPASGGGAASAPGDRSRSEPGRSDLAADRAAAGPGMAAINRQASAALQGISAGVGAVAGVGRCVFGADRFESAARAYELGAVARAGRCAAAAVFHAAGATGAQRTTAARGR